MNEEEKLRHEYLSHEISVKSTSYALHFFEIILLENNKVFTALIVLGLSVLCLYLGLAIRNFRNWSKFITKTLPSLAF